MAAKTEQFNSAASGIRDTIKQSVNFIRGKDVSNYTLLFLDGTSKNPAGSHENIFMPNIVLGRGSKCHVKYGENYKTVSREHASITSQGSQQFLNHNPTATNPTFVNGQPISSTHILKNGDEIQLSAQGPRLRFNAQQTKSNTIGLTSRIGSAVGQAVQPYKKALSLMGLLLVASLAFGGYNFYKAQDFSKQLEFTSMQVAQAEQQNADLEIKIAEAERKGTVKANQLAARLRQERAKNNAEINRLRKEQAQLDAKVAAQENRPVQYAENTSNATNNDKNYESVSSSSSKTYGTNNSYAKRVNSNGNVTSPTSETVPITGGTTKREINPDETGFNQKGKAISPESEEFFKLLPKRDVFYIIGKAIEVEYKGKTRTIGASAFQIFDQQQAIDEDRSGITYGTAFVDNTGTMYTARHVVEPWKYATKFYSDDKLMSDLNVLAANGANIYMKFSAYSQDGKQHSFDTKNMRADRSKDVTQQMADKKYKIDSKILRKLSKKVEGKYTEPTEDFSDWATLDFRNVDANIDVSQEMSRGLKTGTDLYVLGYSYAEVMQSKRRRVEPAYSKAAVAQDYTFDNMINVSGTSVGPGASGGPVMVFEDGKFIVVGIMVQTVGGTSGKVVAIKNVR